MKLALVDDVSCLTRVEARRFIKDLDLHFDDKKGDNLNEVLQPA